MVETLPAPPKSICLLRLSAVGDITHALPLVRTLQHHWPETELTWVIGKLEHTLVGDIPGVEFIVFDKAHGWRAYRGLRKALRGRHFDVLLHMQMALRASAASLCVNADTRIGFDRARAKDLQWLFTDRKIPAHSRQHVLDSFFGFAEALGIHDRVLRWDIPVPEQARDFAESHIPSGQPTLLISPCSSRAHRDWTVAGYAAVAAHAMAAHGMRVILTGGPSDRERRYGEAIIQELGPSPGSVTDLIGQTNLKELLALTERAHAVLSPDSGPAHLATAAGTPVIGLYACTNPDRARPYLSADYVVNRYPEAAQAEYGRSIDELPWGIRVKRPGTMERIAAEEVCSTLDRLMSDFIAAPDTRRAVPSE